MNRAMKAVICALLAATTVACGGMTTRERDTVVGAGVGAAAGAAMTNDVGGAVGGGIVGGVIGNEIGKRQARKSIERPARRCAARAALFSTIDCGSFPRSRKTPPVRKSRACRPSDSRSHRRSSTTIAGCSPCSCMCRTTT